MCVLLGVFFGLWGCDDDNVEWQNNAIQDRDMSSVTGGTATITQDMGGDDPDAFVTVRSEPSLRPRVKFKGAKRWGTDLSRALGLEPEALCQEFGKYDCLSEVHGITLGGVDPYTLGIDEPAQIMPITAAIAADRVALSACSERVARDLSQPGQGVIFGNLPTQGEPSVEVRQEVAERLYIKVLGRRPTTQERDHVVEFWPEVQAQSAPEDTTRQWAILTCFMVSTSLEALFY